MTICRACGHQIGCPDCDARLVEHRARGRLECHQCGYATRLPNQCPECEVEDRLVPIGPGVERIAGELGEAHPNARILVLSSDLIDTAEKQRAEFAAIERGDYDVIIGTQMVAKGHNFPLLTLVGVIDADIGLEGGDLRAAEASFQLLRQVAGRAGRAERPGVALVQSYQPDHPILAAILAEDDAAFYREELARRQYALAPPFSRYVGVVLAAPDERAVIAAGQRLIQAADPLRAAGLRVFGPATAPIARIRGRYRVRLLVKSPKGVALRDRLREWIAAAKIPRTIKLSLDVDPYNFL